MTDMETVIKVQGVTKDFIIPERRMDSVREHVLHAFEQKKFRTYSALKHVSFEVQKGDFFGIIGRNGSGKSTLLKILAKIYEPSSGSVSLKGKVSPFLELGVGFNPELTARENVYVNAALLGMSKEETDNIYEHIISFAELEEFQDMKLKNFSSGMYVRLAFTVAVQIPSDIVILDEVLAVGDERFQEKCVLVFEQLKKMGKTIIFVSHGMESVLQFCDRVLVLEGGRGVAVGPPEQMIERYRELNREGDQYEQEVEELLEKTSEEKTMIDQREEKEKVMKLKGGVVSVKSVTTYDIQGKEKSVFEVGEVLKIKASLDVEGTVKDPIIGVTIFTEDGVVITGPNTKTSGYALQALTEKNTDIELTLENMNLLDGIYLVTIGIVDQTGQIVYDYVDRQYRFQVQSKQENKNGITTFAHAWELH